MLQATDVLDIPVGNYKVISKYSGSVPMVLTLSMLQATEGLQSVGSAL